MDTNRSKENGVVQKNGSGKNRSTSNGSDKNRSNKNESIKNGSGMITTFFAQIPAALESFTKDKGGYIMDPVLKWQYEQLVKELLLLQKHQSDRTLGEGNGGDMIVRKHLMTIEAYSQETSAIETDKKLLDRLGKLAIEAKRNRDGEEKQLNGEKITRSDLVKWSRVWLEELESHSMSYGKILKPDVKTS